MKLTARLGILAILVILTGCSFVTGVTGIESRNMQSWVGSTAHDLILQLGPPDRVMPDGAGGQVLIYGGEGTWDAHRGWNGRLIVNTGRTRVREYYVDKDGIIYSWRWNG